MPDDERLREEPTAPDERLREEPTAPDERLREEPTAPDERLREEPTHSAPTRPDDTGYDDSGVPTFESVREKIETRYGTAIGSAELDAESPQGRAVDEQYEERRRAAAERLAEIRESMRSDDG
jgi:phage shock protein A